MSDDRIAKLEARLADAEKRLAEAEKRLGYLGQPDCPGDRNKDDRLVVEEGIKKFWRGDGWRPVTYSVTQGDGGIPLP